VFEDIETDDRIILAIWAWERRIGFEEPRLDSAALETVAGKPKGWAANVY